METTWAWGYSVGSRRNEPRFVEATDKEDARRKVRKQMSLRSTRCMSFAPAAMNRKDENGWWLV